VAECLAKLAEDVASQIESCSSSTRARRWEFHLVAECLAKLAEDVASQIESCSSSTTSRRSAH